MIVGLIALAFLNVVAGLKLPKMDSWQSTSVLSCAVYLSELRWEYNGPSSFYSAICGYEPAFGSWSTCIYDMLSDREPDKKQLIFEKTITNVKSMCLPENPEFVKSLTLDKYYSSRDNASKYLRRETKGGAMSYPIEVDKSMRGRMGDAYHYYSSNLDKSVKYGAASYEYFLMITVLCYGFKLLKLSGFSRSIFKYKVINVMRGYVVLPTMFGKHASHLEINWLLTGLLPTKLESLMVLGFVLLNLLSLLIGFEIDPYNILFPSKLVQYTRMLGDRSGIVAVTQVPLIILFGTRNNIVEYFTGFKYTTLIVLHKWIGRIMILEVFIHSLAYTLYATLLNSYKSSSRDAYWVFGVIATSSCVGLLLLSIGIIRKCYYETFLILHIVLVVVFFYTYFKHVEQFGFGSSIFLPVALWVIERVIRILRISKFGILKANLQLIDDDIIRVQIKLPPAAMRNKRFEPGQYVFLYFVHSHIFWQSHPFTVIEDNSELTIVIKPKRGATKAVLQKLKREGPRIEMKVLIEGPYGCKSPLNNFGRVLFLAGGSGIPGPLSHAIELGSRQGKQLIDLVLTIRELDILKAYEKELLLLANLPVHLQIHLTKTSYGSSNDSSILAKLRPFAVFHNGRPDIEKLIKSTLDDSALAIVCCGPPRLVDQARDLSAKITVENPSSVVEYIEEYQCW